MTQNDHGQMHQACNAGFGAAAFVAAATTIMALASLSGVQAVPGTTVNLLAMIDAVLFGAVAWGIRRHSRLAALCGLALFLLEKLAMPAPPDAASWVVATVLVGCFVAGVVGVFSHHRTREEGPRVATV